MTPFLGAPWDPGVATVRTFSISRGPLALYRTAGAGERDTTVAFTTFSRETAVAFTTVKYRSRILSPIGTFFTIQMALGGKPFHPSAYAT
uniref:Putative glycine rich protein n=1 Tax=Ixodes ricinus TaxID=34613 RepID=A0A0K8REP5_IXORI